MAEPQHRLAFTTKFRKRSPVLETTVGISEPYTPLQEGDAPSPLQFKAVWDTGASRTVITKKVVEALGIQKIDEVENHTANGMRMAGVYLVRRCPAQC